jgi:hypothetical protein
MSEPTYAGPLLAHEFELDLFRNEGMRASTDLVGSVADANELIRRDPDTTDLRRRLADIHSVAADQVLVTAGGDDALFRCKAQLRRRHALRQQSAVYTAHRKRVDIGDIRFVRRAAPSNNASQGRRRLLCSSTAKSTRKRRCQPPICAVWAMSFSTVRYSAWGSWW